MDAKDVKQAIRERIWRLLEERNVASFPRPVYGRIPNFKGSERACELTAQLPEFRSAKVIKVNPDAPQMRCRELALEMGKTLIMPTPRLRNGFLMLRPSNIPRDAYRRASTITGAYEFGKPTKPWDLPNVDLVIIGSVAVNPSTGRRLGKSHGYAEFEWGILSELSKVSEETPVITTVHELQLVSDEIPREPYDLVVDYIVTPNRVIKVNRKEPKPHGIYWQYITEQTLNEIEILRELRSYISRVRRI